MISVFLLGMSSGIALSGTVAPGTLPISADEVIAGTYAATSVDPSISESAAAEWTGGTTIIIEPPAGFRFDTAALITATVDAGDIVLAAPTTKNPNNPFTIMFFVRSAPDGSSTIASTIRFSGITLRKDDTSCNPGAQVGDEADIRVSTSAGSPALNNEALVDVSVIHGAAYELEFTTSPVNTDAGEDLLPIVTILDQCANVCTSDNRTISLAIQSNPGGATLNGTTARLSVAGVATWVGGDNLNIIKPGNGYTLRASHDGAAFTGTDTVDSAAFNISPNEPDTLEFGTQPATTDAGEDLLPVVRVKDVHGNVVTDQVRTITLTFEANPGGTTLNGDVDLNTVNGVATWTGAQNLNITKVASNYQLRATGSGAFLTSDFVVSAAFDITPNAPDVLEFTVQPAASETAGVPLNPQITIKDAYNNVVTDDDRTITLSIQANPGGATLLGDVDLLTASGVATWVPGDDLNIEVAAAGYTLRATGSGVFATSNNVASNAFNIIPETTYNHVAFTTQPVNTTAGQPLLPVVAIRDQYNNVVTTATGEDITLTLSAGPGALLGTAVLSTTNGLATWAAPQNLRIEQASAGYQLQASSTGVFTVSNAVNSNAFTINPDAPDTLEFSTEPVTSVAGVTLTPVVTLRDQFSNVASGVVRTITLSFDTNPSGATLSGDVDLNTVNGVATWNGAAALRITKVGVGYRLRATGSGAFGTSNIATSAAFDINHDIADRLEFTTQPASGTVAGADLLPVVRIKDQYDNTCTGVADDITLSFAANPGGATLNGTTMLTTVSGVATWLGGDNLNITVASAGYVLRASGAGGYSGSSTVDSAAFTIVHDVPDTVVFSTQPVTTGAGEDLLPAVRIRDQFNNNCSSTVADINLAIENNPGAAVLNGTTSLAVASGVATWNGGHNLNITTMQTGYTLRATATCACTTSDTVVSDPFNITVGEPHHLGFTVQPGNTVAGTPISFSVAVEDQFNNTVDTAVRDITITFAANPGGAALNGTTVLTTVNGVATWDGGAGLNITKATAGYQFRATGSGAYTSSNTVDSAAFSITHAPADALEYTVQPADGTLAGADLLPAVRIKDQYDNTCTGTIDDITLSFAANPGGGPLNGTAVVTTVNGVATWLGGHNLNITVATAGYRLTATGAGAYSTSNTVDSALFGIVPAGADTLQFTTQPADGTVAGTDLLPVVRIQDAFGNTCTAVTDDITLSFAANPGGGPLNGTKSVTTVNGVATWLDGHNLNITAASAGYQLTATGAGAYATSNNVNSALFGIVHAGADTLEFTTQPADGTVAGADLLPVVRIQDAFGNTCTGTTDDITLSFAANPGGGPLNGTKTITTINGVATWLDGHDLNITVATTGYRLTATGAGAYGTSDNVNSALFGIVHAGADSLEFTTQPADGTTAGADLLPAVRIKDQYGNTCTSVVDDITLSFADNPCAATLNGTKTVTTSSGVATWLGGHNLNIVIACVDYRLTATGAGAYGTSNTVDSALFEIVPQTTADHLTFRVQPASVAAGEFLLFTVAVEDQYNNIVTGGVPREIEITLAANPGATVLNGDALVTTVNGVAQWTAVEALNLTVSANNYQLKATGDGAYTTSGVINSVLFHVTPAAANQLVFTTQPVSSIAGDDLLPQVTVRDIYGNTVLGDERTITLTLENNPGATTLNGVTSLLTTNGVATWTGVQALNITVAADDYRLRATGDGAYTGSSFVLSNFFDIDHGTAETLEFSTQPVNTPAGNDLLPVVRLVDANNNTIIGDDRLITLSLVNNPGGATLEGLTSMMTVDGIAAWDAADDLRIDVAAANYRFQAAGGGVFGGSGTVNSAFFDITPNVLYRYGAVPSVASLQVNNAVRVTITARDEYGNPKPNHATTADITISTTTGGDATTLDYAGDPGIPDFEDNGLTARIPAGNTFDAGGELWVDITNRRAEAITITVSDATVIDGTANVTWTAENALDNYLLEIVPGSLTVNAPASCTLTARDQFNNPIPNYTTTALVTISTNTTGPGSNLDFTSAHPAFTDGGDTATLAIGAVFDANGRVTFTMTDRKAEALTVTADDGVASAGVDNVTFNPAAPLLLDFDTIPLQTAGLPFDVTVRVTDQYSNPVGVTQDTDISVSLDAGTGVLGGVSTGIIHSGSDNVVVPNLTYSKAEAGVVLAVERGASGDFLVAGTSNAFSVTGAVAVKLAVELVGNQVAGTPFSVTVVALDALDNPAVVLTNTEIVLSLFAGTGTLSGTLVGEMAGTTGTLVINNVEYDKAEGGVSILASRGSYGDAPLAPGNSPTFSVTANVPDHLEIETVLDQYANVAFSVNVTVRDAYDNVTAVAGPTDITLAVETGTPAALVGTLTKTINPGNTATTFSVTYTLAEAGVVLRADDTDGIPPLLTADTSNAFTVFPSPPVALKISPNIDPQVAGTPFNVVIRAVDGSNNEASVQINTPVVLSLNTGTGNLGGTLNDVIAAGTSSITLNGVTYDKAEVGVSLAAACTGGDALSSTTSNLFTVSAGAGVALRFVQQPTNTAINTPIITSVEIIDALGNRADAADAITLELIDPGCGGAMTGTTTLNAAAGLVAWTEVENVTIDWICSGYQLRASAAGLGQVDSDDFNVGSGTDLAGPVVGIETDGTTVDLSVTYTINGSETVAPFRIDFGLERNTANAAPIDHVFGSLRVTATTDRAPGVHTVALGNIRAYLDALVEHGDWVAVRLDAAAEVSEANEANNLATRAARVDLSFESAVVDIAGDDSTVTLTYNVESLARVPNFTIDVSRDADGDGTADDPFVQRVASNVESCPGTHVVTLDIGNGVLGRDLLSGASVPFIVCLDYDNVVTEADEVDNNCGTTTDTLEADLVMSRVAFDGAPLDTSFDVTVTYRVQGNRIAEDFTLQFYASSNADVEDLARDVPIDDYRVRRDGDKTVGTHTLDFVLAVPTRRFPDPHFFLKVRIDDALEVQEQDETNNVAAARNDLPEPEIVLESSPDSVAVGEEMQAIWRVTNRGSAVAPDLVVVLPIPPEAEFVAAGVENQSAQQAVYDDVSLPAGWYEVPAEVDGDTVYIPIGDLDPDAVARLLVVLRRVSADSVSLAAAVSAGGMQAASAIDAADLAAAWQVPGQDDWYDPQGLIEEEVETTVRYVGLCGASAHVATLLSLLGLIATKASLPALRRSSAATVSVRKRQRR